MFYLFLIFLCANDFFWLFPWAHAAGAIKSSDIGIVLITIGIIYQALFKRSDLRILSNSFTWLFIAYLLLATAQAAIAAINYHQSIISGLLGVRDQFYYLSFIYYLLYLKDYQQISKLLNAISLLAIVLFVIAILDYVGLPLYKNTFAETVKYRAGIEHASFAGMELVSVALLWQVSRWAYSQQIKEKRIARILAFIFLAAHVFRQARFRLFSVVAAITGLLIMKKKFKTLAALGAVSVIAIIIAQLTMDTNIITYQFASGFENVAEGTGSMRGRTEQFKTDMKIFMEYPWFGSGTAALHAGPEESQSGMSMAAVLSRKADLGYSHWLKHYGIVGLVWLLLFYIAYWVYLRRMQRHIPDDYQAVSGFCMVYMLYFYVSFVTLNHLMFDYDILLVSLVTAVLVKSNSMVRDSAYLRSEPKAQI